MDEWRQRVVRDWELNHQQKHDTLRAVYTGGWCGVGDALEFLPLPSNLNFLPPTYMN